jgi:hypothetical protein
VVDDEGARLKHPINLEDITNRKTLSAEEQSRLAELEPVIRSRFVSPPPPARRISQNSRERNVDFLLLA